MVVVAQGVRFGAPDTETGAFVEALGVWSGGADAETHRGDAEKRAGVLDSSREEFPADALSPMSGQNVHAPEMDLVRGFDVTVAIKSKCANEVRGEGANDDGVGRARA